MFNRLRERKGEEGFTLIELLVVIIIIGILAGIAIPIFLSQRNNARNAAIQSDLRNAATAEETVLTETGSYTNAIGALTAAGFAFSEAENYSNDTQSLALNVTGSTSYCLQAASADGTVFSYSSETGPAEAAC